MANLVSSPKNKENKKKNDMPDTLLGFGYEFSDGKLQNVKTKEPFQFVVREGDHAYNQKHYEALGEVITEEVYTLLETECNLKRLPVPYDAKVEPATFIFTSDNALTNPDKLFVLIHGSGVVRAGQWARRLIINDSIESGTQIPFIKKAQEEGYGILVMNTNDNSRKIRGKTTKIRGSENPEEHAAHVWKHYVKKAEAKHIALIAHSYGGCVTTALFQKEKDDFMKRVFAVAMTDSVHYISHPRAFKYLVKISRNWVSSQTPLDTPLNPIMSGDIKRVSAGVNVHEQTSWSSFESVFKFLQKRYDAHIEGENDADKDSRAMSIGSISGDGDVNESIPEEDHDVSMEEEVSGAHAMSDSNDGDDDDKKKQTEDDTMEVSGVPDRNDGEEDDNQKATGGDNQKTTDDNQKATDDNQKTTEGDKQKHTGDEHQKPTGDNQKLTKN